MARGPPMNDMQGAALGSHIIDSTFSEVLISARFVSPEAKVILLSIGLQESEFKHRIQMGGGPAHSFWQEEPNGIRAVMRNEITKPYLQRVCNSLGVDFNLDDIYEEVTHNDILGCVIARLLLYADPHPLPKVGDSNGAWAYYLAIWRPGKPRPQDWPDNYKEAMGYING